MSGFQLNNREMEFLNKPNVSILDQSGKDYRRLSMQRPLDDSGEALLRRADALLDEMSLGDFDCGDAGAPVSNGFVEDQALSSSADSFPVKAVGKDASSVGGASPPISIGDLSEQSSVGLEERPAAYSAEVGAPASSSSEASADAGDRWDGGWDEEGVAANGFARKPTLIPAEQRYVQQARSASVDELAPPGNGAMRASKPATFVRRQSTSLANSMTVGGRLSARSLLLPRELETDIEKTQQEIQALLAEITTALPATHEAAERSRHLLNKAQHILEENPSRTAEVDYYLQQVRRIVQRTRQMQNDSALYRRRLTIYLSSWVVLAALVLIARYWMQSELLEALEMLFWRSEEAIWVQFVPMLIGAIFAGALGAALGALYTMQRHAAREYGYFDRKYGLRGLILPLLGGVFGTVLAILWAAVCIFVGLDENQVWIGAAPAVLAFVFGLIQEWLYGVR
jgi:ElaB/YqjD/DUF883 family membrane-anchored ribosome-binding protein